MKIIIDNSLKLFSLLFLQLVKCFSSTVEACQPSSDEEVERDEVMHPLICRSLSDGLPSQDSTIHLCPHISLPSLEIAGNSEEGVKYLSSTDHAKRQSVPSKEAPDHLRRVSCPVTRAPVIKEDTYH